MTPRYVWRCPADALLRREYETAGAVAIAAVLGITPQQVQRRASRLRIRTRVARGRPFTSVDPRRGKGKRFSRA